MNELRSTAFSPEKKKTALKDSFQDQWRIIGDPIIVTVMVTVPSETGEFKAFQRQIVIETQRGMYVLMLVKN